MAEGSDRGGEAFDVVIVGGGPAGTTAATLLKKYAPDLRVLIVEKETFPRDHIGESQLPAISSILDEMECWEKVERAGFPIKLGASLTWGRDAESWDFDFFPVEEFKDEPRPARFEGQRRYTAFQVDRSIYDTILLRHAESMGAVVREGTKVEQVRIEGDRVVGIRLSGGDEVTGRYFIDASGTVALLRRALGIEVEAPSGLRNIAMWDYWENAEWAVRIGVGGTRIQVRSLPYGWLWFIPLGPTRTSLGLVCPAEHYKSRGLSVEELYHEAVASQPQIASLVRGGTPRGRVETTKDWSILAERTVGENWFLTGEAAGFADPILSAGMTLAHTSARDAAYTILELERAELDGRWLRRRCDEKNRTNIRQHIRFAEYWYAANACFTDLRANCQQIAKDAGLRLTPEEAWRWLAQGGFTSQRVGGAGFGSFDLAAAKRLVEKFVGGKAAFSFQKFNVFKLNLIGAQKSAAGDLGNGRIRRVECYERAGRLLPLAGCYGHLIQALKLTSDGTTLLNTLRRSFALQLRPEHREWALSEHMQALEAMVLDGWVGTKVDRARPMISMTSNGGRSIRTSAEGERALREPRAQARAAPTEPA